MWDDQREVPADQMPEEARAYAEAVMAYQDHPIVQEHFHQITLCQLPLPDGGAMPFFVMEFRAQNAAVLVWEDGHGNWGVGDWQELASSDAVLQVDLAYFQGSAALSFAAALEHLRETRPPRDERGP
jgi:hypothetical protein